MNIEDVVKSMYMYCSACIVGAFAALARSAAHAAERHGMTATASHTADSGARRRKTISSRMRRAS